MREIERQFLCPRPDPAVLEGSRRFRIVQGYLTSEDPAVRVRRTLPVGGAGAATEAATADGTASGRAHAPRWTLTVKSGVGRVRDEVEVEVAAEEGEALLRMAGGRTVEKVRHRVGRWEVDLFGGPLDGLVAAEVELERPDEPLPEPPPGLVLGPEVTDEPRWTNQALAHLDADGRRALLDETRRRLETEAPWTR